MKINAAAISVEGQNLAVALVGLDLVNSPGEADMAINSLQPTFGSAPVVLMAQKDDGTPVYYGDEALVRSLAYVPVDQMPWKEYSI